MKKAGTILLLFCLMLVLGAAGSKNSVRLDANAHPVYLADSAEAVLYAFKNDSAEASIKYKEQYVRITGNVTSVDKKGSQIQLKGKSDYKKPIYCDCPKELREQAKALQDNAYVAVWGKLTVDPIDKDIRITVSKLSERVPAVPNGIGDCYTEDEHRQNSKSDIQSMENGRILFPRPVGWKNVEAKISDGIGTIEGYQYSLNKLTGSSDVYPELFFVCYFNNRDHLANIDDSNKTEDIQKAIIANIISEKETPSQSWDNEWYELFKSTLPTRKTYYGAKYAYYQTNKMISGTNYTVEFVFQPDGNDGIVLYLYVYHEPKHLTDIMFLMRFLSINA